MFHPLFASKFLFSTFPKNNCAAFHCYMSAWSRGSLKERLNDLYEFRFDCHTWLSTQSVFASFLALHFNPPTLAGCLANSTIARLAANLALLQSLQRQLRFVLSTEDPPSGRSSLVAEASAMKF